MSNNRNVIILVAIVVALGALYALSSQRRPSLDTSGGFVDLVEGKLSTDEVQRIELAGGGGGFTLVNGDGGWIVENHFGAPANLNKIRTLLGNLESFTGELRSDEAGVLASYALDDSSAYRLTIDDRVDLLIGKQAGSGCFVRMGNSDRVYVTDHNFLSDFGLWGDERKAAEVSSWVDLLAFQVTREDVTRVVIEGEETVTLDRELIVSEEAEEEAEESEVPAASVGDNYEWRINSDFIGSRSKGDAILSSLVSVRARDVLARGENPEGSGLDDPDRVTVTVEAADDLVLLFGGPIEEMTGQVWFRVEGQDLVWAVPEYVKNNLFKTADELRAE
jgi:hypothetical protein